MAHPRLSSDVTLPDNVCEAISHDFRVAQHAEQQQRIQVNASRNKEVRLQRLEQEITAPISRRVVISSASAVDVTGPKGDFLAGVLAGDAPGHLKSVSLVSVCIPLDAVNLPSTSTGGLMTEFVVYHNNSVHPGISTSFKYPINAPPVTSMSRATLADWINQELRNASTGPLVNVPPGTPLLGGGEKGREDRADDLTVGFHVTWEEDLGQFVVWRGDPWREVPASPNFLVVRADMDTLDASWRAILGVASASVTVLSQAKDINDVNLETSTRIKGLFGLPTTALIPGKLIVRSSLVETGYISTTGASGVLKIIDVPATKKTSDRVTWEARSTAAAFNGLTAAKHMTALQSFRLEDETGSLYSPTTDWVMEIQLEFV